MAKEQKQKTEEKRKEAKAAEAKEAPKLGIEVAAPALACDDRNCPIHGDLKVRGRIFVGIVLKSGSQKTSTVAWERSHYIPKYERYERRRTKIHVHNPPCINAKEGDVVKLAECRPLSKTKNFVIIEKVGRKEIRPLVEEETKQKESKEKETKEKEHKKTEKSNK